MALNGNAVLKVGTGHFYTGAVDATLPVDLSAPDSLTWTEVGHTSLESIIGFESEGGEATTLGTLQAPVLRQTFAPRTDSLNFTLMQWDADSLKLHFGANMTDVNGDGSLLGVPTAPDPTEASFLCVLYDGSNRVGLYAPRANLFRGDDVSLEDTDSLAGLPIQVTPLVSGSNDWAVAWTPIQAAA